MAVFVCALPVETSSPHAAATTGLSASSVYLQPPRRKGLAALLLLFRRFLSGRFVRRGPRRASPA